MTTWGTNNPYDLPGLSSEELPIQKFRQHSKSFADTHLDHSVDLREQIAKALGLIKGGITDHPSPANEHYYLVEKIEDPETEELIMTRKLNFEEEIEAVLFLIQSQEQKAIKNFKDILKMSDTYTFEDGTKFVRVYNQSKERE